MSRKREKNYVERSSFVMWSKILWLISLSFLPNEQKRWTELCWDMFICPVIFDHSMNLAFFSSKWAEQVNTTMLRHVHLSSDLQSSDPYRLVFFEISRTGEQNYTIQIAATDDYILHVARIMSSELNPTSNIYVKYSNEVWNFIFYFIHTLNHQFYFN
jgi:hypothetical protein